MTNYIRTSTADIRLLDNNIIHVRIDDRSNFGLPELYEVRNANALLSKNKPYSVIFEVGTFVDYTSEARNASILPENTVNRIGLALIQKKLGMKIMAEFYLKIIGKKKNTKIFDSINKAQVWLRSMHNS